MRYFGVWPYGVASRSGTCGPSVGRSARHTYVDDFPRLQFDEEKRKERPKEEISDLEKIASPDFSCMIAEEGRPLLPSWATEADVPHVFLNRAAGTREYPA
jgi:hypothetical protein